MAILGQWSGGTVSILPGTTWAAPASLFPTQDRNDSSAYSFAAATSTLTLPGSGLANGYLLIGSFEFVDTSNGRHNPQARFIQASGTGNFVSGTSSGFNRDNSEDTAWVKTWAFVDAPSASSTFTFQWRRDSDSPTGGTTRSQLQVIPLYYSNHGIYSSASTACTGGTTPTQITGFTAVDESDTAAIEIASNVITLKGDNKRYLALGSSYWQGIGSSRTQRWHGFRVDGTMDDTAKGYSYGRNGSNADIGEMFTTVIPRVTTDITVDQFIYRGPAVGTFPNAGGDVDGNTTGSNPNHVTVILELNDSAEVFKSHSTTQQDIDVAGTRVDLQIADVLDANDAASFTKASSTVINAEVAGDMLLGANVGGGYASTSTARYTGYAEFTLNGTGDNLSFAGDYGRGNQSTTDCWGWSANLMSFVAPALNDDLGVNAGKITGGEGGTVDTIAGWVGFWGVNLDTLEASGGDTNISATTDGLTLSENAATISFDVDVSATTNALTLVEYPASITVGVNVNATTDALALAEFPASITHDVSISATTDSLTLSEYAATVDYSVINVSFGGDAFDTDAFDVNSWALEAGSAVNIAATTDNLSLTEYSASITYDVNVNASTDSLTLSESAASIALDVDISANADSLSLTEFTASISNDVEVNATADNLSLTENQATISFDRNITANTDSLVLTEYPAAVSVGVDVQASTDSLVLTEYQASVFYDVSVNASTDSLNLVEYSASITFDRTVLATSDGLTLTTYPAAVGYGVEVGANTDALTLTEYQASISFDVSVQATTDALTLTEYQAAITTGFDTNITASSDSLSLTEHAATVSLDRSISATLDSLTLVENQASVALNVDINSSVDGLTLNEYIASVSLDAEIQASVDNLALTEYPAEILVGIDTEVSASTEALTLEQYAASITLDVEIVTNADALTLAEYQASILLDIPQVTIPASRKISSADSGREINSASSNRTIDDAGSGRSIDSSLGQRKISTNNSNRTIF